MKPDMRLYAIVGWCLWMMSWGVMMIYTAKTTSQHVAGIVLITVQLGFAIFALVHIWRDSRESED